MKTFLFLFLFLTSIIFPQGIYFSEPLSSSVYYSGGGSIAIPYNMYHSSSIVVYDYYAALLPNGGSWTAWQYGEIGGWYIAKSGTTYIKGKAWVQNLFGGSPYWTYRDPFSFSTIDNNSPSIPTGFDVTIYNTGDNAHPKLIWDLNDDLDVEESTQAYYIERKINSGSFSQIATVNGTTDEYIDYGVSYAGGGPNTATYKIRAKDVNSNFSSYTATEVVAWGDAWKWNPGLTGNPEEFMLLQNYPNPFNPSTQITYVIAEESNVQIKIYDILGNEVVELVNEIKTAGYYEATLMPLI